MLRAVESDATRCEAFISHGDGEAITFTLKHLCLEIMKRRHFMLLCIDSAIILSSFFIAYMVHFETGLQDYLITKLHTDFEAYFGSAYFWAATIFMVLCLALMARDGLYSPRLVFKSSLKTEIKSIVGSGVKSLVILMAVSFLFTGFLLSRFVYGIAFALSLILMISLREIGRRLSDKFFQLGFAQKRTLIIGTNPAAILFATNLESKSNGLSDVVSFLEFADERCSRPKNLPDCKVLGKVHEIDTISTIKFDRIIVSAGDFLGPKEQNRESLLMRILNHCEAHKIPLYLISFSTDGMVLRPQKSSFEGIQLLLLRNSARHPVKSLLNRILDIVVSAAVLIIGFPIWTLIAIAIKMTSSGPVLCVQERTGTNGKTYKMLKFRCSIQETDHQLRDRPVFSSFTKPALKIHNNPTCTRLGSFLRRCGLDEIPKFVNIIRGDMSIEGFRLNRPKMPIAMIDLNRPEKVKSCKG